MPGDLSIARGEPFCAQALTCAGGVPGTEDALMFSSSTSVAAGPADDGQLTVGARQYLARS